MVIVAALLHARWNSVAKKTGGNRHVVLLGGLVLAGFRAPVGAWLGWNGVPRWSWLQWVVVATSGLARGRHVRQRRLSMLSAALVGGRLLGEDARGQRLLRAR